MEILINIVKCRREPCVVSVGVFRNVSEAHLTQEIAQRLQRHMDH